MRFVIKRGISRLARFSTCEKVRRTCKRGEKPKQPSCLIGASGIHPSAEGAYKSWRNIALFINIPLVILCAYNVATTYKEPKRPKFLKFEYMRIRHKKFPWCGGTDKSFFHNPNLNALSDGYETEEDDD